MAGHFQGRPRIVLLVSLVAMAAGSSGCHTPRGCAAAPPAIGRWVSATPNRDSGDRANLETFLAAHPGAVNAHYGWDCRTPLHAAVTRGHAAPGEPGTFDLQARLGLVRSLLAAGADVNAREPDGARTALISAIGSGPGTSDNEPIVRYLVEHGADVHARDARGTAALAYAAGTGSLSIVTLLLEHGADTQGSDKDAVALGDALSSAAYGGYADMAALLIARGADVNWRYRAWLRANWRALPLALALTIARTGDQSTMARRREVAEVLLEHGANVNARDGFGRTLLHAAAADGDLDAIELLLSHGAAIAARDDRGVTPLQVAADKGNAAIVRLLTARGAGVTSDSGCAAGAPQGSCGGSSRTATWVSPR